MLKRDAMIIAMSARDAMEEFHIAHLTNAQMKELNPMIRKGIFNALVAIAAYEKNANALKYFHILADKIPPYWEMSELEAFLKEGCVQEENLVRHQPRFLSAFLQNELTLGNLSFDGQTGCYVMIVSARFKGIDYNKRHAHRDKIAAALRKEGFAYGTGLGYHKRL